VDRGYRFVVEVRLPAHEIIERLQPVLKSVGDYLSPGFFHLALYHRDTEINQFLDFWLNIRKQRQGSADMKSPDQDLQPSRSKTPGNIGGSRKLVGLDTDQRDDCFAVRMLVGPDDPVDRYFLHRIIQNRDSYFEIVAKNLAAIQIFRETAEAGECVARQDTPKMADYIALVIVFGRLNQDNGEPFAGDSHCGGLPSHYVKYSHTHKYPGLPMDGSCRPDFHPYCALLWNDGMLGRLDFANLLRDGFSGRIQCPLKIGNFAVSPIHSACQTLSQLFFYIPDYIINGML